jgi:hypothetical protein
VALESARQRISEAQPGEPPEIAVGRGEPGADVNLAQPTLGAADRDRAPGWIDLRRGMIAP